jgi:hypothetical protein
MAAGSANRVGCAIIASEDSASLDAAFDGLFNAQVRLR